eukprot:UN05328
MGVPMFFSLCVGYQINDHFNTKYWQNRFHTKEQEMSDMKTPISYNLTSANGKDYDYDWDSRNESRPKKKARRHIFLIRHGQYFDQEEDDDKRCLTELGKEQCHLTAERLKSFDLPWNKIIISTKLRAKESGDIIKEYFPGVPVEYSELLEEGRPAPTNPNNFKFDPEKHGEEALRIKKG